MKIKLNPLFLLLAGCCFWGCKTFETAQIDLRNPSFEDTPQFSMPPDDWIDMGFPGETPPDVQPGFFGCTTKAHDGETYLGMVARDTKTNESLGQRFEEGIVMQKGKNYSFSLSLAHSKRFISLSKLTNKASNFDEPVKLVIWSMSKKTPHKRLELLAESPLIGHEEWRTYTFSMTPEKGHCYGIVLEVFWGNGPNEQTNGNILVDNCSSIILEE